MQELLSGVELPKKLKSNTSTKTIVLVGQPNSGKSTLFNALSDVKVSTANFAGTTVEYKETHIEIFVEQVHLIDLPGIYSLNPIEPAEFVTVSFFVRKSHRFDFKCYRLYTYNEKFRVNNGASGVRHTYGCCFEYERRSHKKRHPN